MTWSDIAAWVQAIGSIAAIGVAIWVPWRIHQSEQHATRKVKDSYKSLLREAFEKLREPIVYLDALNDFASVELPGTARASSAETAAQLASANAKMQDVLIVIREIEDVRRLDDFNAILAILNLRPKIEAAMPDFKKEAAWLRDHPTSEQVVRSAVGTLGHHAHELRGGIEAVLTALQRD